MKKYILGSLAVLGLFSGCGNNLNLSDYPIKVRQPVYIPEVCKAQYDALKNIPKVAILNFTNNSSFDKANVTTTNTTKDYEGGMIAGVVAGTNGIGVGAVAKEHSNIKRNETSRIVNPKLEKAIASAFEGVLVEMGGAEVYTRQDLDKVIKEQKLQQSGLMDESTLVEVGKLAGVKYIITGSIDSVTQKYDDYENAAESVTSNVSQKDDDLMKMALKSAINFGASAMSGMKITTRVTFKIIDVQTGKILFSKQVKETKNIGKIQNPTYDQIIGGIKDDIMQALQGVKPELSEFFSVNGYILQVRTDKDKENYVAQINLGKKDKVKPSQTFKVLKFEEYTDPISGDTKCDKITMDVKLKVSNNQIQQKTSWTVAIGRDVKSIRPGQIIKRDVLKNSLF